MKISSSIVVSIYFLFEDGAFGAIGNNRVAFVSRNGPEEELFIRDVSRNIDVKRLLESSRTALRHGCQKKTVHPSIQFRTVISFREYALTKVFTHFSPDEDIVDLDRNQREFVGSAMAWMQHEAIDILDHNLLDLWLIPLWYRRYYSSRGAARTSGSKGMIALLAMTKTLHDSQGLVSFCSLTASQYRCIFTSSSGSETCIWLRVPVASK